MLAEAERQEYLDEIRQEVCSRCVERPAGGPPCGPLGKPCGVELHLDKLVRVVQEVHSDWMGPYLEHQHKQICESCPFLRSAFCPCPMDTLAMLVVQAIEAVEERRQHRQQGRLLVAGLPPHEGAGIEEITRAYEDAVGQWVGCDWATDTVPGRLNLQGWSADAAAARAIEASPDERQTWEQAERWLEEVERRARSAEAQAALAVAAANAGEWDEAIQCARRAWGLEFSTGRPLRREPTWEHLFELVEAARSKVGAL